MLHEPVNQSPATANDTSRPAAELPTFTPEWDLLLAASSSDPITGRMAGPLHDSSAKRPIDWAAVLRLATDHGISSLLHHNLPRAGSLAPPAILASLRQTYETNVHKSLFLTRELFRILDSLDALGIEAIPYKGVVLSDLYYGDMALRQSGDIDVFVHAGDVLRIKNAVRDLGFVPRLPIPAAAEKDYIASGYECTFDSPAGKNLLELKWALQPRFYSVDYDLDGLFKHAENVPFAGRILKTLSPEDLLLVLSVHAAKHVWGRLIWLCDIDRILQRDQLNWDWVSEYARELGVERILRITLCLAHRFLRTKIPSPMESSILGDKTVQAFADKIAVAVVAGTTYEDRQISYFRLMMQIRERPADRLRFLTRLAFTPGPGEWEKVRLPRFLFPLYRVVRLARLASRLTGG